MKRILLIIVTVLILIAAFSAWRILGPGTAFSGDKYDLYVRSGMTYEQLLALIEKDTVIKSPTVFDMLAGRMDYKTHVKAGKYEIPRGTSLLTLLRELKNGHQTPVHFTILKVRTHEGLAGMVGRKLECDSSSFLAFTENNDSLKSFGVDSNTYLSLIMPDTYTFYWNTTAGEIMKKFAAAHDAWWTPERIQLAKSKGLTPAQAVTLASIVEEETNASGDKGKIASVYLNRMARGMRLAADPTVKFALKDFELKRVYEKHLQVESPYNTYKNAGLPPGPICTPSRPTLQAILNAPETDYLFFVAKPDFSGYSNFAADYKQHEAYANEYRKALDREMAIRDSLKKAAK